MNPASSASDSATKDTPPPAWDDTRSVHWPSEFEGVEIPGEGDSGNQRAYLFRSAAKNRPLVVSLHTWSGDYTQRDPLATLAREQDWNYCHPDFQGRNNRPEACLSPLVIDDIRRAIAFACSATGADVENVFVVGASGGGYATLGAYLRIGAPVKAFLAWVAISDLEAWYWQSRSRKSGYADDVAKCTGGEFNAADARLRSPLHWEVPAGKLPRLEIFAGIEDGYVGSVPVSHSVCFFNKMVRHLGGETSVVSETDFAAIMSRGLPDLSDVPPIEGRAVKFHREIDVLSLTLFQGGHEMLPQHCFSRLKSLSTLR